jgi:hypothetical protein
MDSSFSTRLFLVLLLLIALPGAAMAVSSKAEKPPCPCNLRGEVVSWSCIWEGLGPTYPYKLPNVEVEYRDCMGGWSRATTDEKGQFEFPCAPNPSEGCPFCFRVIDVDVTGYITAFDASLILRHLVRLEPLEKCPFDTGKELLYPQKVAADVNCNAIINAYDAALILKYTVGLIDHFPCSDAWVHYPTPNCVETCASDVILYCICIGDVSGPSSGPSILKADEPVTVKLGLPSHYSEYVEVPVRVAGAENVYSADFVLTYDPDDFDVVKVENGDLTKGFMLISNSVGGDLLVAMAGSMPFSGDGDIAVVTLQKKHPMLATALNRLVLSDVILNEFSPTVVVNDSNTPEIFRLSLGPVSPNPAAGSATIAFNVSRSCRASLGIYSVEGQLIRTVFSGDAVAGANQVIWDGTDDNGRAVARGIYFCRMEAGDASATEKIVFVR